MINKLNQFIDSRLVVSQPQYTLISFFLLINYVFFIHFQQKGFLLTWPFITILHGVTVLMCAATIFRSQWPNLLKAAFPIYWYTFIMYCLIFFPALLFLISGSSLIAIMNILLSSFLLIITTYWLDSMILLLVGSSLAFIVFYSVIQIHYQYPLVYFMRGLDFLLGHPGAAWFYLWTVIVAVFFSRNIAKNRENLQLKKQINAMRIVAGSVAHELRTPLLTINSGVKSTLDFLKSINTEPTAIDKKHHQQRALKVAKNEITAANTMIDMLLMNLNQRVFQDYYESFYIKDCVNCVLTRYPFQSAVERQKVTFRCENNFKLTGNKTMLIHVFFNLIKNSLYFIKAAEKGDICISAIQKVDQYQIIVRDTGLGIDADVLPYIFDQFFSRRKNGAGLGLSFCKMIIKQFGGNIQCQSQLHEYTEFTLTFPVKGG